jgi:hypothetical protein
MTGVQDPDAVNGTTQVTASTGGATPGIVTVNVIDDDVMNLDVDTISMVVPENGPGTFKVRLTAQPTADLSVDVGPQSSAVATASPTILTFTTTNWNQYQAVQVFGTDDVNYDHDRTGIDVKINGLGLVKTVTVVVADDDLLAVDPSGHFVCAGDYFYSDVYLLNTPLAGPPQNGMLQVDLRSNGVVNLINPQTFVLDATTPRVTVEMHSNFSNIPRTDRVQISAPGQRTIFIDPIQIQKHTATSPPCI